MDKIIKLVVVLVLIGGAYTGYRVVSGNFADNQLGTYMTDVMGPNNPTTQCEGLILKKATAMGFDVDPASVKVSLGAPEVDNGPVASRISNTITTNMVTGTATVTYRRSVLPGWTKTVTLTRSKKFVSSAYVNKTR